MKYKPGLKTMYMSRWCQVTKTHFLYYAEGVPYASYLGRPLAVIPIDLIESVRRVYVEVPERQEKFQKLKNFQFEIFMKGSDEFRWSSRVLASKEEYVSPLKQSQILKSGKKYDKDLNGSGDDYASVGNGYEIKITNINKELSPIKENNEEGNRKRAKDSNHLELPG